LSPISARYPIVEVLTAAAFGLQAFVVGDDLVLLVSRLVLTALLIVLFGTDLDTQRLPNVITLPGIVVGVVFSLLTSPGVVSSLLGVLIGGGLLLFVRWGWKRATGVDGMGLGDVKMLAMIGAFLGWQQVFGVLLVASLAGAVVGLALAALQRRSMQTKLPFGTFLAVAAYMASIVGDDLLSWYLSIY
jgi:leader peptidase (prepilin peptidase)/N-methyltransferase